MADSFLSPAQVASLRQTYADGMQTLQEWSHAPEITIVRQSGAVIGTLVCIAIRLDDRQAIDTGAGTPTTGTERFGTVTAWEDDLPATAIRQGDRFLWAGRRCIVATPPVETLLDSGVVRMTFTVEEGAP